MDRPNVEARVHRELARVSGFVPRLSRSQLEVLLTVLGAIRPETRGLASSKRGLPAVETSQSFPAVPRGRSQPAN